MTLGSVNVGGGHGFENGEKEQMQSWLKWMLMCRENIHLAFHIQPTVDQKYIF